MGVVWGRSPAPPVPESSENSVTVDLSDPSNVGGRGREDRTWAHMAFAVVRNNVMAESNKASPAMFNVANIGRCISFLKNAGIGT